MGRSYFKVAAGIWRSGCKLKTWCGSYLTQSAPATPWAMTCKIQMRAIYETFHYCGLAVSDGTKIIRFAIWRFGLRLDGYFDETVMMRIQTSLASDFAHWTPTVISKNDLEARIKIDRTIHLKIAYEPRSHSEDGRDHQTIRSDEIEISYGAAKSKIDRCISPLLSALVRRGSWRRLRLQSKKQTCQPLRGWVLHIWQLEPAMR
jgi:hypothetical protein